MFSIVVFAINITLDKVAIEQKYIEYDFGKGDQISLLILICNILVTYIIPIGFFFYVWIIIKIRNYLPSVSGREKELVSIFHPCELFGLFFFQFIGSFYLFLINDPFCCCCCFDCLCTHFSRYFSSALFYVSTFSGYRECAWW